MGDPTTPHCVNRRANFTKEIRCVYITVTNSPGEVCVWSNSSPASVWEWPHLSVGSQSAFQLCSVDVYWTWGLYSGEYVGDTVSIFSKQLNTPSPKSLRKTEQANKAWNWLHIVTHQLIVKILGLTNLTRYSNITSALPCICAMDTSVRGTCHLMWYLSASVKTEFRLSRELRLKPVLFRRVEAHTNTSENRMRNRSLFWALPFCFTKEKGE